MSEKDGEQGKDAHHTHTNTKRAKDESAAVKSFPSPPKSC